ncbi:MAG: sigma-70 family RNA polymerase sigma factor [Ignavibacteriota bacterium]
MASFPTAKITQLLNGARSGNANDRLDLEAVVYAELRKIAGRMMSSERNGHTLQATVLADDAFMDLVHADQNWQNRAHFFASAAIAMRQILVDHSRRKNAAKRGGSLSRLNDDPDRLADAIQDPDTVLAIDQALTRLASKDPKQAQIVELRYFGGLTEDEIAEIWQLSPRTVRREWSSARAWLYAELTTAPTVRGKVKSLSSQVRLGVNGWCGRRIGFRLDLPTGAQIDEFRFVQNVRRKGMQRCVFHVVFLLSSTSE